MNIHEFNVHLKICLKRQTVLLLAVVKRSLQVVMMYKKQCSTIYGVGVRYFSLIGGASVLKSFSVFESQIPPTHLQEQYKQEMKMCV